MAKSEFLIGRKVMKRTGKPFKSTLKINTIKGIIIHEDTGNQAFIFQEDNSYVELPMCIMADIQINLQRVEGLYPGHVLLGVKEYYISGDSWIKIIPSSLHNPEHLIMQCYMMGAEKVTLVIKHEGEKKEPDYSITELIKHI
mgnify:FL=1